MVSIVLPLHGVVACTLFMLLIHLHLTNARGLTVLNTLSLSIGAIVWPLVLLALIYIAYVKPRGREQRLQLGLADGRWRTFMGKANTDYEIDGEAFKRFEQEAARRKQHKPAPRRMAVH